MTPALDDVQNHMPEEDTNAQIAFNQRRDVRKTGSVAAWSLLCIDDFFRYEKPTLCNILRKNWRRFLYLI